MKRLLQFVVLAVVALLAVPPSLAEGICQMLQPGTQTDMPGCCASMSHAGTHNMPAHESMSPVVEAQACNYSCCSVSPQIPSPRTTSEKAKVDSTKVLFAVVAEFEPATGHDQTHVPAPPAGSLTPRHILLRTFRI
jgi:hypothetical protein